MLVAVVLIACIVHARGALGRVAASRAMGEWMNERLGEQWAIG